MWCTQSPVGQRKLWNMDLSRMLRKTQRIRCTSKVTKKKKPTIKHFVHIHYICYCMLDSCTENYHGQSVRYGDVNGISQLEQCILSQFLNEYIYFFFFCLKLYYVIKASTN